MALLQFASGKCFVAAAPLISAKLPSLMGAALRIRSAAAPSASFSTLQRSRVGFRAATALALAAPPAPAMPRRSIAHLPLIGAGGKVAIALLIKKVVLIALLRAYGPKGTVDMLRNVNRAIARSGGAGYPYAAINAMLAQLEASLSTVMSAFDQAEAIYNWLRRLDLSVFTQFARGVFGEYVQPSPAVEEPPPRSAVALSHEPSNSRFVGTLPSGGKDAELAYQLKQIGGHTVMDMRRTFVPETMRGEGVAELLAAAAFEYAASQKMKVIPTCPYISKTFLKKHPLGRQSAPRCAARTFTSGFRSYLRDTMVLEQ
jgi:predicted GNAT family acetyltransferase